MNNTPENFYKLQLAHDLIIFLLNLQTQGMDLERKVKRTSMILDVWDKGVNTRIQEMADSNLKNMAESEDLDLDLDALKILTEIHQLIPTTIRKELKTEVKDNIFKSFGIES
jgi:hypothetical protein